jgi:hypothetical protein
MEDVALFLHLLGVLLFAAGIVFAGIAFEAARRRERPEEIALLLSLTRFGVLLVVAGGLLQLGFGLWLVELEDIGYGAGVVMVAVFFTFALLGPLPPKEMGVILGIAVLLDTFLVRLLLLPVFLRLSEGGLVLARLARPGAARRAFRTWQRPAPTGFGPRSEGDRDRVREGLTAPSTPARGVGRARTGPPPWARLGSNQRPLACEASALPLSYAPGRRTIIR